MKRRLNNIFAKDGKTFVLAMDHGVVMEVGSSIASPASVIEKAVAGGVDAILTSYGVAQQFSKEIGNIGLILRVDGGSTILNPSGVPFQRPTGTFKVEDAVSIGADGVLCMGWTGTKDEELTMQNLANFASECRKYGVVFGAEMIPGGFGQEELSTLENIAFSNRLGAEYGADFIKSPYRGDSTEFRKKVVDTCYKPIIVLGGGSNKLDLDLITMVRDAMDAGCKGVAIGRNIWKHQKIEKLCQSIGSVIHNDYSIEKAMQILSD